MGLEGSGQVVTFEGCLQKGVGALVTQYRGRGEIHTGVTGNMVALKPRVNSIQACLPAPYQRLILSPRKRVRGSPGRAPAGRRATM